MHELNRVVTATLSSYARLRSFNALKSRCSVRHRTPVAKNAWNTVPTRATLHPIQLTPQRHHNNITTKTQLHHNNTTTAAQRFKLCYVVVVVCSQHN